MLNFPWRKSLPAEQKIQQLIIGEEQPNFDKFISQQKQKANLCYNMSL